jgi:hypothetical protein
MPAKPTPKKKTFVIPKDWLTKGKKTTPQTQKPGPKDKGKAGIWPVNSKSITQYQEGSHHGVDVGVPIGTRLVAPEGGEVIAAGTSNGGYGKYVKIKTPDGKEIILGHMSQINVNPGQQVKPGQLVGLSGNTGNSTGPHVHIEVRKGSGFLDPLDLYTGGYQMTSGGTPEGPEPFKVTGRAGAGQAIAAGEAAGVTPMEAAQTQLFGSILPDIEINWTNVIAGVIGVALITVGVTGLVLGEAGKMALGQVTEPLKKLAEGTG